MNVIRVFNKAMTKMHYIDTDEYTRISRSTTLCGLKGKKVWRPNAVYIGGLPMCKVCKRKKHQ